jgi:hypothetical protein
LQPAGVGSAGPGQLHEALASAIWILGTAMAPTCDFITSTETALDEVDMRLAHGLRAPVQ